MSAACCDHDAVVEEHAPRRLRDVAEIRRAAAAGVLVVVAAALDAVGAPLGATAVYAVALVVGGSTFVPGAVRGLSRGRLGVATLMTAGAAGAVVLGELAEAAMLAFLFSISEALEAYAVARARRGLRALLDVVPPEATVLRDGRRDTVPAGEISVDDVILLRPGERLATDGIVARGRSSLDLSAITGESVPVEVGPGDDVPAGAVNGGGALEVRARARAEDNSLARIVRIVEEAQERKARAQRLSERVAGPLVPAVFVVAAAVALVGSLVGSPSVWILRALVVLVAAAPCAFAISVPVAVVAAVGAAARAGAIIKGGAALEALGGVGAVAIDKTGTLTRGDPRVVGVAAAPGVSEAEVLAAAAALEAVSEHPLAGAILGAAAPDAVAADVVAVPGRGLVGTLGGARVRLGRPDFIPPEGVEGAVAEMERAGATVVVVEREGRTLGAVAVRDEPREEAAGAVAALRALGVGRVVMLTGDNPTTAGALAREVGIAEVAAALVPEEKAVAVERLRAGGRVVAMVGDGINDAPALAAADVGVAMGARGSDAAIEAADVALMGDDLGHLPEVLAQARRSLRITRQNLALSASILVALVPLAVLGVLGLAAVVAVHELAEIAVVANGLRAGRRRGGAGRPPGADLPAPGAPREGEFAPSFSRD